MRIIKEAVLTGQSLFLVNGKWNPHGGVDGAEAPEKTTESLPSAEADGNKRNISRSNELT